MMSVELDGSALNSSVAFTGRLGCMSRAEAFELVRQRGGTASPAVTKHTQVLIVGELGWPLLDDGRPSNKLSRATTLGIPILLVFDDEVFDLAEAERLYRLLMKSDPTDASAAFNLGNMLRGSNRAVEAEAALRAATRANPGFAEAWYNLADLLDDQGRPETAIECLRKALVVSPDYMDATFNLALLLQRTGSYAEAADYWRQYLTSDSGSEWATRARRSLKFCEIQINLLTSSQAVSDQAA
jgi:tetratricopeptide (TPR) repeat protein